MLFAMHCRHSRNVLWPLSSSKHGKIYVGPLLYTWVKRSTGVSRIFERGVQYLLVGSLKKGHQILKGGVQWSDGGGPVHKSHHDDKSCIYLDAKE